MYRIARIIKQKMLYVLTLRFIFGANQHENETKRRTENNHKGILRTVAAFPLGLISNVVNGIKDSTYGIQNNSGTEKSEEKAIEINHKRGLLGSITPIPIKLISQPIEILKNSYDFLANKSGTEETSRPDGINNKGLLGTITAIPAGIISRGIQGIRSAAYNIITDNLTRNMGIDLMDKEE